MNKPTVLVLGASGFVGGALFSRLAKEGFSVVGTYYLNQENVPKVVAKKVKSEYFNFDFLDDTGYVESLLKGIDVVIDCTSANAESRNDVALKFTSIKPDLSFLMFGSNSLESEVEGIIKIRSEVILGERSKFHQDVIEMMKGKVYALPQDPMTTGKPIHIKDVVNVASLLVAEYKNLPENIYIEGCQKITLRFLIKIIAKYEGESFIFTIGTKKSWAYKLNKFLKENLNYGFSDDGWDKAKSYGKDVIGTDSSIIVNAGVLSIEARLG